jgi:hypothetical protein
MTWIPWWPRRKPKRVDVPTLTPRRGVLPAIIAGSTQAVLIRDAYAIFLQICRASEVESAHALSRIGARMLERHVRDMEPLHGMPKPPRKP